MGFQTECLYLQDILSTMRGWFCLVFFQYVMGGFRIFSQEKLLEEFLVSGNYGNPVKHHKMFRVLGSVAYEHEHDPCRLAVQGIVVYTLV